MTNRCYYNNEFCQGPLWQCQTCKEWYCQAHFHWTALGKNVECAACERERVTLEQEQEQEQAAARDDLLQEMDLADLMALGEMNGDDLPFLFEETDGFFDPG